MKTILFLAILLYLHIPAHAQQLGSGSAGLQQFQTIDRLQIYGADPRLTGRSVNNGDFRGMLDQYNRSRENDILKDWKQSNIRIPEDFTPTHNSELKRKLQDLKNTCPQCSTGVVIGGGAPQVVVKPPPSSQPMMALPAGVMVSLSYGDYQRMLRKEQVFDRLNAKGCAPDQVKLEQKVILCAN